MEIDDKNAPGVSVKVEEKPLTPKQQLMSDCNRIAMEIITEKIKDSRIGWDFKTRRDLETQIEKKICDDLFGGKPYEAPSVRLTRDKKTKLVSLLLEPPRNLGWRARMKLAATSE